MGRNSFMMIYLTEYYVKETKGKVYKSKTKAEKQGQSDKSKSE